MLKLMIGSAQFGMNYGIANTQGKVSEHELIKILSFAKDKNIHLIDTASVYGQSEEVLGKHADAFFNFITKLPALIKVTQNVGDNIHAQLTLSLQRLGRRSIYGILIHQADDLLSEQGEQIYAALQALKQEGKTQKIGVSVYSPEQANKIFSKYHFDILQFPLNLLDQRFIQHSILLDFKSRGVELHARSIFLQGLLLMDQQKLPAYFDSIRAQLAQLNFFCQSQNRSLVQTLIDFILANNEIDYCIVGIDNYQQLVEIVTAMEQVISIDRNYYANYACHDINILNPSKWKH